jgi:hypothetical protein
VGLGVGGAGAISLAAVLVCMLMKKKKRRANSSGAGAAPPQPQTEKQEEEAAPGQQIIKPGSAVQRQFEKAELPANQSMLHHPSRFFAELEGSSGHKQQHPPRRPPEQSVKVSSPSTSSSPTRQGRCELHSGSTISELDVSRDQAR